MSQLPSETFLIQQIGSDVVLYNRYTEEEIVRYPVADPDLTAKAQQAINESQLSDEDKAFAHFWSGYFYAYGSA